MRIGPFSRRGLFSMQRGLLGAVSLCVALAASQAEAAPPKFAQNLLSTFNRHDVHVIVFLADHPQYDAVEAFVTKRSGQEPLIRAVLTELDGHQIDIVNDEAIAAERAALLTERTVAYGPIGYQEFVLPNYAPRAVVTFDSDIGEDIVLDLSALFPPSSSSAGLVNPGNHATTSSLPVMLTESTTLAGTSTIVSIDGVTQPLRPGPFLGAMAGYYTSGFNIGVIRAGSLDMELVHAPTRLAVGEYWEYVDQIDRTLRYDVTGLNGDLVQLRKSTGAEEIILARRLEDRDQPLELVRVRVTGVDAALNQTPPEPFGFVIDLSVPGRFSLGISGHDGLVTGAATRTHFAGTATYTLAPALPDWAVPRTVVAGAWFDEHDGVYLETLLGSL